MNREERAVYVTRIWYREGGPSPTILGIYTCKDRAELVAAEWEASHPRPQGEAKCWVTVTTEVMDHKPVYVTHAVCQVCAETGEVLKEWEIVRRDCWGSDASICTDALHIIQSSSSQGIAHAKELAEATRQQMLRGREA